MKTVVNVFKSALLLGAAAIAGLTILPSTSEGNSGTTFTCSGSGHTCHVHADDTIYHLLKQ